MSYALRLLLPVLTLSLSPVALAGGAAQPMAPVSTAQLSNDSNVLFMEVMSMSNLAEIQTSDLALKRSQNPEVRTFAEHMISMHTQAQKELRTLAASKGVFLTTKPGADQRLQYNKLSTLSGAAFDAEYKAVQAMGHKSTLSLIQTYRSVGKDAATLALAAKAEPMVASHLAEAGRLP